MHCLWSNWHDEYRDGTYLYWLIALDTETIASCYNSNILTNIIPYKSNSLEDEVKRPDRVDELMLASIVIIIATSKVIFCL